MPEIQPLPTLRCPRTDIDGTEPFNDDLLNRKDVALKLTSYLDRLREGAVLAIDAPWGEGKTWFGKNWEQYLKSNNRQTIYLDAFEQDYVEDPFMLLASEFVELIKEDSEKMEGFKDKATKVAKATMSIGTKIGLGLLTKYTLGEVDLGKEIESSMSDASEEVGALSSKWIEAKFNEYEQNKQTITAFRNELKELAEDQDKPIVIFIDELDRCKPDFAVRLIERIKHFFDVPNIVFVLLINKEQLESAIKGVYGVDTDASAYLGKFINLIFQLPKPALSDIDAERQYERYIVATFNKYEFGQSQEYVAFVDHLKFWAPRYKLSLRDIEKIIALYAFAQPVQNLSYLLVYVIILKVKKNTLFQRLLNDEQQAHIEAKKFIDTLIDDAERRENEHAKRVLCLPQKWHEAHINNFIEVDECISRVTQGNYYYELKNLFRLLAKKVELEIGR